MDRTFQKTTEIHQVQFIDKVVDVFVVLVVQVPQVQVVEETVEIPQSQFVEKIVVIPEILTVQGAQTFESLGTAPVRQVAQAEIVEVWRSERLFPQNLHHPNSSRHLSWKVLQLLWGMFNPLPCGVRGARTRGHVRACSGRSQR